MWVSKILRGSGISKFLHVWQGPARIMADAGFDDVRVRQLDTDDKSLVHTSMLLHYHYSESV